MGRYQTSRQVECLMLNVPFDLQRFIEAQSRVWSDVMAELRDGRKRTHWMWFVFPQLTALGRSPVAKYYGLSGPEEASAYLADSILGVRLKDCCQTLLGPRLGTAVEIFGTTDTLKLRSCLTLFAFVAGDELLFRACLLRYFDGEADATTLRLLAT